MFPTQTTDNPTSSSSAAAGGKVTFTFDFDIGDFLIKDGKLQELSGFDALKIWIKKILNTKKDKFRIYEITDSYGVKLLEYVNSDLPFAFIKAEIQKEITEILLTNEQIKSVENFSFERDKRTLKVNFTVNTIYGPTSEGVTI